MSVERGELELAGAACLVAHVGGALIAVVADLLGARDARAAFARVADSAGVAVAAPLSLGQSEEGAFAGRRIAGVDCAGVVVVAGDLFARETDSVVAVIVLRARIAVAAAAGRIVLVAAAGLDVAGVDRARVVVVAVDRGACTHAGRLAGVARGALVEVVAGDGLAVRRCHDRLVHTKARRLGVTPIFGARVVVVAVDRGAFAGARSRTLGRLDALVLQDAVASRLQARAGACIDRAVARGRVGRARIFLDEIVRARRARNRNHGDHHKQKCCRTAHERGLHLGSPCAATARL